ncbi:MAG: HAD family hydrolase [Candidatus Thorarchaeota archaeon]
MSHLKQIVYTPIRALLLDFDGTIVDTKRYYFELAAYYLRKDPEELVLLADDLGFSKLAPTVRNVKWRIVTTVYQVARALGIGRAKALGAVNYVRKNHLTQFSNAQPTSDAVFALKQLYTAKVKLAIVSHTSRRKIQIFLETHLKRTPYFASGHILAAEDLGKNKEDGIVHFLRKWEMTDTPREMAIVGDLGGDIIAGKNVGITTIGLTTGFGLRPILEQTNPDAIYSSLLELEKHIHLFFIEER